MTDLKPGDRGHRRSWKNLLINKRYQLRFTLFMVGLAAVLMVGLGVWVMRVANETTEVSMASVRGQACPQLPALDDDAASDDEAPAPAPAPPPMRDGAAGDSPAPAAAPGGPGAPGPDESTAAGAPPVAPSGSEGHGAIVAAAPAAVAAPPPHRGRAHGRGRRPAVAAAAVVTASAGSAVAGGAAAAGSAAAPDDEPHHVNVQIDESSMTLTLPRDLAEQIVAHWACELLQVSKFDRLEFDRLLILWAMIATGILLVVGLAVYGIKMTHRVAGPLFKVSLYLTKMRAGRFDKVYNLRKGDQLVEFYDHFKLAHDGIVAMQRDDISQVTAVIAAAEAAGAGGHPAIAELRELVARKEKSIE